MAADFTDGVFVYGETTYRRLQTGDVQLTGSKCLTRVKWSTASIEGRLTDCLFVDLDCDGRLDWCIDASQFDL